ncbi:hypothetical protein VN97_g1864 [Penicillium thymicola]|uniref:Uncharacterized protein n=1 Tax=Penicillium thymicola TaxID=293382 RepID=A0AAI9XBM3_PENTH|nr:hypothetical protein VN97_g1864 [Penicillium thymicola]
MTFSTSFLFCSTQTPLDVRSRWPAGAQFPWLLSFQFFGWTTPVVPPLTNNCPRDYIPSRYLAFLQITAPLPASYLAFAPFKSSFRS